jgi:hypothetical protein
LGKRTCLSDFLCSASDCKNKQRARFNGVGYCQTHYRRMKNRGTLQLPDESIWRNNLKKARYKHLCEVSKLDRKLFPNSEVGRAWRAVWQVKYDAIKSGYKRKGELK